MVKRRTAELWSSLGWFRNVGLTVHPLFKDKRRSKPTEMNLSYDELQEHAAHSTSGCLFLFQQTKAFLMSLTYSNQASKRMLRPVNVAYEWQADSNVGLFSRCLLGAINWLQRRRLISVGEGAS